MRFLLLTLGWVLALPVIARAQTAADLTQQGIRAYRQAEFEAAAAMFRRALELPARDTAADVGAGGLLDYLGAAELYRGKRDSAVAVFRRILQRDPRHRLDDLVFPPEVSSLLDEVRRATKIVGVQAAADTIIRLQRGSWQVRLVATSFQSTTALVATESGTLVRELYFGPLSDSLTIEWDGRDSVNQVVPAGRYSLAVTSSSGGRTMRILEIPLTVTIIRPDTLPLPSPVADSLLLPEHVSGRRAIRSLLGGLAIGAAASALPALVANGAAPSPARFAIGGAIGFAGLVSFAVHPPSQPLPANVAANRARREAWQAQWQHATEENARLRAAAGWEVRMGAPTAVGSGVP